MKTKMKTASCKVVLDKSGQDVVRNNVTPAEAMYFVAEHNARAQGNPLSIVGDEDEVERSSGEEIARLYSMYPAKKIRALYPTVMSSVPATFEEAISLGMGVVLPTGKLMEFSV